MVPPKEPKLEDPKAVLNRELWAVLAPGIVITLLGFMLAFAFVGAPPPKTLRFASGSNWGAYNKFAQMYKAELAKEGLAVEVLETKGSTENLQLLIDGKADIAFVQGGILPPTDEVELVSLGSVYFEPLWLFVRSEQPQTRFSQLSGKRVAIGPEGSGTRAVALELLEDAQVFDEITAVDVWGETAEQMLYSGEVDAVFIIGSPTIDAVSRMLGSKGIQLMQFERSKAIERRHQFLSLVPLYAGVVDLKADIPAHDVELLAPAATLVVRSSFHKALPPVILATATEIHGSATILSEHGAFPSPQYCSFPIAREARFYYDRGLSFLYRHLPFYLASGLDRLAILLLPFIGLLIPIIRLLPPVYNWTMKRKIYKQYRNLQRLENKFGLAEYDELAEELNEIEVAAKKLASMPPAYGADIYALRSNLERVRDRLSVLESGPPKLTLRKADKSAHRKPGKRVAEDEPGDDE
ncbi:MAG: TAXI family TRAP transporter solute-binding subunit [Vulcanimicrobiota bacterium]